MNGNNLEKCSLSELRDEIYKREFAAGYLDSNPETITGIEASKALKTIHNKNH